MPTYDPTGHARLSEAAAALSPETLAAYADEAESLLGIVVPDGGAAYTGAARAQLTLAVVLQVNRSVALDAHGGGVLEQEEAGEQSYRVAAYQGRVTRRDPDAAAIVERVTAAVETPAAVGAWPIAGSLR